MDISFFWCFFWDVEVLRLPKGTKHPFRVWRGLKEHVCRILESISKTQRGHWDFSAVKVHRVGVTSKLLSFST